MNPSSIVSIDPALGEAVEDVTAPTTTDQVAEVCQAAAAAAGPYEAGGRKLWSRVLRAMAEALEARRPEIVLLGQRETALPAARLEGELSRTVFQARLFADVVDDGAFLEATIDHAAQTPMGPGPDLRRMLIPIGPVAVFGASNFPLAFSVPGGDTVSALAVGCPVVLKGHESHPALSVLAFETLREAARKAGAPENLLGLVFGRQAGIELVMHPSIQAVGFTGSLSGGRALTEAIALRPDPIPFFGELASLNPVVVTAGAASARGNELARDLVSSVTGSAGQLCTKPGLVLIPTGPVGDVLVEEAARLVTDTGPSVLLNARVRDAYADATGSFERAPGMRVIAEGSPPEGAGYAVTARLLETDASQLLGVKLDECFGPTTVILRYEPEQVGRVIDQLPGSLTATIHAEVDERELVAELTTRLRGKAGRLLYAGFPTGVLVSWAQHHGGPWPATNSQHTSVGATAVRRFQRPMAWQSAPSWVLPEELLDGTTNIPRRVDGTLDLPS